MPAEKLNVKNKNPPASKTSHNKDHGRNPLIWRKTTHSAFDTPLPPTLDTSSDSARRDESMTRLVQFFDRERLLALRQRVALFVRQVTVANGSTAHEMRHTLSEREKPLTVEKLNQACHRFVSSGAIR